MNSSPEPKLTQSPKWLAEELSRRREPVEEALGRWLPPEEEPPRELHAAMRYAVLGGGKRLRPILLAAAADACGGEPDRALPAAVAVELVHCYSLVHDDLPAMDDDDLRRGRPTCHRVFGEAVAVLAGDALLTLAFEVLARAYGADGESAGGGLASTLVLELARAAGHAGMVAGQAADILSEGRQPSEELLRYIHGHKTGALIRASVRMGALVARASEAEVSALGHYGECVGLTFQIADDILDVTSSPEELGKATQKDLARGKLTYPALVGLAQARRAARRLSEEAVASLQGFGPEAGLLVALAHFVTRRTR